MDEMEFVKYFKCINNKNFEDELTIGKIYIGNDDWDNKGMIEVANDKGESWCYAEELFEFECLKENGKIIVPRDYNGIIK